MYFRRCAANEATVMLQEPFSFSRPGQVLCQLSGRYIRYPVCSCVHPCGCAADQPISFRVSLCFHLPTPRVSLYLAISGISFCLFLSPSPRVHVSSSPLPVFPVSPVSLLLPLPSPCLTVSPYLTVSHSRSLRKSLSLTVRVSQCILSHPLSPVSPSGVRESGEPDPEQAEAEAPEGGGTAAGRAR